ncbi:MAG: Bifunctional NAD(P)H-hydrate repair enzyme Nnr [Alphaproteobacteria bacterium MarineAlpha6_Bin3]|nr:MAG: Bifunctional NAD(P)H-hydrate repair enzyme Nnr [Alphaproteobacteria bacterium MarineAlpha6_Bin3]|tara:strand:+ start:1110 stop:2591 length:1482 start_codon:yes stop_codon:yes gene_type:complete
MLKKNIYDHTVLTCKDHTDLDKKTIKKFMSGYKLMENAGKIIFEIIKKKFNKNKNIKILCGSGNNGGDAFIVAKLLKENGFKNIELFCLITKNKLKGDAKLAAEKININIQNISNLKITKGNLIIDGLLGSGLNKNIAGNLKKIIEKINSKNHYCISIDIPSGINGDTGEIKGVAVKSDLTITFTKKKPGHLISPGKEYSGDVIVKNIGIDLKKLFFKPRIYENNPNIWKKDFPWPNQNSHKYTRGFTLIICGEKITGASRLAARGAARIGCGLLCLGVPKKSFNIYATENPIALIETIDDEADLKNILKDKRINTILIGPGLGVNKKKLNLILKVIKDKKRIVVLDADALKNNFKKIAEKSNSEIIVTPHYGEFSKILKNLKIKKTNDNLSLAKKFVKKTKYNLLLKGNSTIISSNDGKIVINTNSSPFLATGGSGDVLAGMITGLIAQGMKIFESCCAATWIHGEIAKKLGPGLIAEDLPDMIPKILKKLK